MPNDDAWDLPVIYRVRKKKGRLGRVTRLIEHPGRGAGLRPSRVLAVFYGSGKPMADWNYSLMPFPDQILDRSRGGWSRQLLYFRFPIQTAGMTILFEAEPIPADQQRRVEARRQKAA